MSDLARMLQAHDFELWAGAEHSDFDDADDVFGATLSSLKAMSSEFQGLAQRLDKQTEGQAASSATASEQLSMLNASVATLNKSMLALLASHATMQQSIVALGKAIAAPKRLIKDANGKPVGVEVMT